MNLSKAYQPGLFEADIYALWERKGAFSPQGKGKPYALVVPPPNANGNLHMGHALSFAVQDIAARYHRLLGENVLYLPGADHAGFETQVVFERHLQQMGKSRLHLARETQYQQIYEFVSMNKNNLDNQVRRLGASVDWSRYTFSLDEHIVRRAYATFKSLLNDGLVYRGERLINYCTFHHTAFADIEVDYEEEQGHLWHLSYPLVEGGEAIEVATTRPETLFGDTAVAVNPDDSRYQHLIGKTVKLPLTEREIPIIADSYVQPEFGTGAVKITPAHDPNDFEVGKRHDLPMLTVISFEGTLNHQVPEAFRGLNVEEGREAVVTALKDQGLLKSVDDYVHNVGHCYKCGTVIQPLLKEQWFIDTKRLAKPAIEAIEQGKLTIVPEAKKAQLVTYLSTIKDWNISRQIAWGIPIPAFQNENDPDDWQFNDQTDQEVITIDGVNYRRDPDVFDTWFSSSSWPYATLNYPEGEDFKQFFPLALMESGFDILMPWVSRMLMLSLYVTGQVPFKHVYLHGLITDDKGRKMSKSKGNGVNPMEVIDRYGADALRIGIISGTTPGNNQPYIENKMVGGRNFCNKLWNIARYIESLVEDFSAPEAKAASPADHWILDRFNATQLHYQEHMDNYRFSEAFELLYAFIWNDLADWYIECSKTDANQGLLANLLKQTLVMVHPFAPFVSEAIWQTIGLSEDSMLIHQLLSPLPAADSKQAAEFSEIINLIGSTRSILQSVKQTKPLLYSDERVVLQYQPQIRRLAHIQAIEPTSDEAEGKGMTIPGTRFKVLIGLSDEAVSAYRASLNQAIAKCENVIQRLEGRLSNDSYLQNAPSDLVKASQGELAAAKTELEKLSLARESINA